MYRLTRLELALRALTAIFVLIAVGALLWRPALPAAAVAPAGIEAVNAPAVAYTGADPDAVAAIIGGNIFASSRTAPATRYNPQAPDESDVVSTAVEPAVVPSETDPEETVPRLYGIVTGPQGTAALLRLDAAVPAAQLLREGESAGRYRVVKINEQSVVLSGPAGRVELRLIRPEG